MPVSDFARTDVPTAAPDTPLGDVAAAMRREGESVVAVLAEGRPRGLLTDATIGRAFVAGEDLAARSAVDVAADPVTVPADADVDALVAALAGADERRAVVVDADGTYVGVVSAEDALRRVGRDLTSVLDLLA